MIASSFILGLVWSLLVIHSVQCQNQSQIRGQPSDAYYTHAVHDLIHDQSHQTEPNKTRGPSFNMSGDGKEAALDHRSPVRQFHLTNGFIARTLSLTLVVTMALTMVCTIRALYRRKSKWSKEAKTRYDSLPTAAINSSLPKNAFVLNDSDEEETLFDASHRLIK